VLTVKFLKIFPDHENQSKNGSFHDMLLCVVTIKGSYIFHFKYLHEEKKNIKEKDAEFPF